jgi:hypothetical protein
MFRALRPWSRSQAALSKVLVMLFAKSGGSFAAPRFVSLAYNKPLHLGRD